MKHQYSFGPVIVVRDDDKKLVAKCLSNTIACKGYLGGRCMWARGEKFAIPSNNETPDACEYKAARIAETEAMINE